MAAQMSNETLASYASKAAISLMVSYGPVAMRRRGGDSLRDRSALVIASSSWKVGAQRACVKIIAELI